MRSRLAILPLLLALIAPSPAIAIWSRVPTDNLLVATGQGNQIVPTLCPDGTGGAIVAWNNQATLEADANRISASGALMWGSGISVLNLPPITSVVGVVSDGEGGAIALCTRSSSGGNRDIFIQRLGPDGSRLWAAEGVMVAQNVNDPTIASDGHQGALVCFSKVRVHPDDPLQYVVDIYAQRIDASGAPQWAAGGVLVNPQFTNSRLLPQVCADGSGGAVVSWHDVFDWDNRSVSLQRLDASGNAVWNSSGVSTGAQGGQFLTHRLASDGAGGGLVSWNDSRNAPAFPYTTYAQRVDGSGSPRWGSTGTAVTSELFYQDFLTTIESDGSGGAIVVWGEDRSGNLGLDLYAQHLDVAGTRLWSETGAVVCDMAGDQMAPRIISDGRGGPIISWYDRRDFDPNIYVQRLDADGKRQWGAEGVQVMNQPVYFQDLSMISDDDGGAILAWSDRRTLHSSIFAQRVRRNGKLGGPQGPKPPIPALAGTTSIVTGSQVALLVDVPKSGPMRLALHDVTGRRIRTWQEGFQEAGPRELRLDLRDDHGRSLRSGLYFLDLAFEGGRLTHRIVVQR